MTPLLLALLTSCGGEQPAAQPGANPSTEGAGELPPPDVKFDLKQMQASAETIALVPSPAEMQKAVDKAGIATRLASMVKDRDIDVASDNNDQVAVRTGVVLAQLLLTAKEADKAATVAHLERVKIGLDKLQAGEKIGKTVDDLKNRVQNDSVNRDDLIKELDELSGVMVPELRSTIGDRMVPLIQAGSWLEGAYLVSGAIKAEQKYDKATMLLRQPEVVEYFLDYVKKEGTGRAEDKVIAQLETSLVTLQEVTRKEALAQVDVETIHSATQAVLALL